jgi:hypothetical protein
MISMNVQAWQRCWNVGVVSKPVQILSDLVNNIMGFEVFRKWDYFCLFAVPYSMLGLICIQLFVILPILDFF